ncbi:Putative pyridoxal-phosphate dependent protein F13B12.4 [Toxocara canis]|uniref:Putative pyridoxal-phosphate dependent protein F13B12.4 n=1 Tax=Toxocara canis TaxID=6265 RepID=A0A0B2V9F7_TOXCA|nr:Putative pyridoxal-phosphate dependent protein F13B12.4 [Toxocara canis]
MLAALITLALVSSCSARISPAPIDHRIQSVTNSWRSNAITRLWAERGRMGRTPLFRLPLPGLPYVDVLFKDESATESGSLKHRYAWALLMWAVVDGKINANTTVYEASAGNTAASEAYFCTLIGLKFVAVIPYSTEQAKVKRIESYGGSVLKTKPGDMLVRAQQEADRNGGFFMNQFANSDKAEEFHESGDCPRESANLMHEILAQMRKFANLTVKRPHYFVHPAGTGGTITSVGRYAKKYDLSTEIVLADSEFSVYCDYVMKGKFANESGAAFVVPPGMAGTGFGSLGAVKLGVTSSLLPTVIDRVIKVPDLASTAAMFVLKRRGVNGGASTGLNLVATLHVAATASYAQLPSGQRLTIVTSLGDSGDNYISSYLNRTWIADNFKPHGGLPVYECWIDVIERSMDSGSDALIEGTKLCTNRRGHT